MTGLSLNIFKLEFRNIIKLQQIKNKYIINIL